jgi:DNA-binding transcriptional ArsR family regulator
LPWIPPTGCAIAVTSDGDRFGEHHRRPPTIGARHREVERAALEQQFTNGCTVGLVPIAVSPDLDVLGRVGAALADETRRRILTRLLEGPAYPAELADALCASRSNISNHLACLRGCGLVATVRQGRQVRYQLSDRRLAKALRALVRLALPVDACVDHLEPQP